MSVFAAHPELVEQTCEQGKVLYDLRRYPDAEKTLRQALSRDPNHWESHVYLSLALVRQSTSAQPRPEKEKAALDEARRAVKLGPEREMSYFVLALAYFANRKQNEAVETANQGLRLNPEAAWAYLIHSEIYLARREWAAALRSVEAGLKYEPEMVSLLNNRSTALIMLEREAEAAQSIQSALRLDPTSDNAHTNRGWLALYQGEHAAALSSFREALRLDPQSEVARQGFLRALQARNPLYHLMLAYTLWTSRLTREGALVFVIGLAQVGQVLGMAARFFPPLYLIYLPWMFFYSLFVFFSWISDALFSLLLRFSPSGRLVLSKDEVAQSNWFGLCLLLLILNIIGGIIWRQWGFVAGVVLAVMMMTPAAAVFKVSPEKRYRRAFVGVLAALLGSAAICGQTIMFINIPWASVPLFFFVLGWFIFPWIANLIIISE